MRVLYAALAATGSPLFAALAMVCFGLVAVGLFGAAAGHRFRRGMTALTPAVLLFNAALLTIPGTRMMVGLRSQARSDGQVQN
ncbi:MAG: hypothetical protein EXR07_10420 [Acetobacteraceae bacterium]|nr:hypothetical protein [Acetobacteraceae bacterium]